MGWRNSKAEQLADEISNQLHKTSSQSVFTKLRSTIILFLAIIILLFLAYVVYRTILDIQAKVGDRMNKRHVSVSSKGINIQVKGKNLERVIDSGQRYTYNAWLNSKIPDNSAGHLKLKEWSDRKRKIYSSSGTEAANSGWG